MKIELTPTNCVALGVCESVSPVYFEVGDDGNLLILRPHVEGKDLAVVEEAVRSCPTAALRLVK